MKAQSFWHGIIGDLMGLAFLTALVAGCSSSNQREVAGQVTIEPPQGLTFADDIVELRSKESPDFIAAGLIQPDGTFRVECLVGGKVLKGVPAGSYQARIVISDDDPERRKKVLGSINKKFLSFDTSELTITAPNTGVQVKLTK